jgi:hypothetical protein
MLKADERVGGDGLGREGLAQPSRWLEDVLASEQECALGTAGHVNAACNFQSAKKTTWAQTDEFLGNMQHATCNMPDRSFDSFVFVWGGTQWIETD